MFDEVLNMPLVSLTKSSIFLTYTMFQPVYPYTFFIFSILVSNDNINLYIDSLVNAMLLLKIKATNILVYGFLVYVLDIPNSPPPENQMNSAKMALVSLLNHAI